LTLPVRDVLQATPRARIVRLDLGGRRFTYEPGQAVTVGLPGARRSPYSIAGAPDDVDHEGCLELLVGTDGNSPEFQEALRPGILLDVQGPLGQFTFGGRPGEQRFTFIAGGTGIAPLRSMLRHALRDPRHTVALLYSARTPEEFAYYDEFDELARAGRIDLHVSVTRHPSILGWHGGRGRIGRAHAQKIVRLGSAPICFICGPTAFVGHTRRLLIDAGLPHDRVRVEDWMLPRRSPFPIPAPGGLTSVVPSLPAS
jgi:ferredoxin-NADP reductase